MLNNIFSIQTSPTFSLDQTCLIANDSGLHRSQDGGQTWENIFNKISQGKSISCTAAAFSPDYANDRTIFAGVNGSILTSYDNANTWIAYNLPTPEPIISKIIPSTNFCDDNFVVASTMDDGIFLSNDKGKTWKTWNFGLFDFNVFDVTLSTNYPMNQSAYLAAESGVFISKNGGCTWKETSFPIHDAPVLSIAALYTEQQKEIIIVGTENNGLYASLNDGKTWQPIKLDTKNQAINQIDLQRLDMNKYQITILSEKSLLRSMDNGETWISVYEAKSDQEVLTCFCLTRSAHNQEIIFIGTMENGLIKI